MGILTDILREAGRKSAVPSATGSGVGQISEREQAIIDRHTSEAGRGSLLQGVAKVRAQKEIAERRQWRTYAEQAPPEIAEPVKEMLSNLDDRAKVRSIYQKLTPEQRQEALRLVPGISQQLGDDRGGAVGRTLKSLRGGIANVIQPGMEMVGTGGTPEEIEFIRQLEAAESQEFASALPSDPWYERFPLQAAEMVPFMAATGAGNIVGSGIAKAGGNVLARGAAAGNLGAKAALQAAGAAGKLPTAVGLPAATAQATIARAGGAAGITAVGFPGQYAQEIDQLKELGVEDGPGMQALAVGTSLVSSALEAIMPNPFKGVLPTGAVSIRDGATTAARQYLWEAIKRAPPEISEEYAQGLASGLGKTVASYLDMTTQDVTLGDAFATSFEQGNAAIGPMAFLLGVPALAGAGAVGLRARAGTPPSPPPVPPAATQAPPVQPQVVAPSGIPPTGTLPEVTPPVDQTAVVPPTVVPNQTVPPDQSQRLARLQEIRRKGFVSEDEAIEVGTGGKNRKERLANLEKAIEQEASQGGAAPPVPSLPQGIPDETQVQPNEESTVQGQARVQGEQEARIEGGEQQAAQGDAGTEVQVGTYEEFRDEYRRLFSEMMKYSPDEVGSSHFAERMAVLSDQNPEWAERVESEQEVTKQKPVEPRKFSYQNGRVQVEVPPPYEVGGKSVQPFVMNGKTYIGAEDFKANADEAYAETVKRYPDIASQEAVPVSDVAQPPVTPAPQQTEATGEQRTFGRTTLTKGQVIETGAFHDLSQIQDGDLVSEALGDGQLELESGFTKDGQWLTQEEAEKLAPGITGGNRSQRERELKKGAGLTAAFRVVGFGESPQQAEATTAPTGARRMEPTEEGRPADGKPIMPGDRFLTNTGRETTPYPKYSGSTNRQLIASEKKSQLWLMENAIAEAESRGDDFNLNMFRGELEDAKKGKLPQASKDSATLYVFGESVPKVPKPLLKKPSSATTPAAEKPQVAPKIIKTEKGDAELIEKLHKNWNLVRIGSTYHSAHVKTGEIADSGSESKVREQMIMAGMGSEGAEPKQPTKKPSPEPTGEQDTGTERELSVNRTGTEQPEAGVPATTEEQKPAAEVAPKTKPPASEPIPKFTRTTPGKGSTTRQFQAERVEKARAEIADLERKRRTKQGEHDGLRSNATKKRAAVRGEIASINRMIGKIQGEIASDMASDTLAKLEDELESPRSYDHYLAGMKAIHRLKASVAEDAARRGEMGRDAARTEIAKEEREADRFDAELQGRAKEIAKSQGFDSGDAEQIALAASNGFTVFEDRSLADIVEFQGKRTRESRVSQEIGKMFSPGYSAKQDLSDEQKEEFKKQYQEASQDDKNWLAKRKDVDKAVSEAIEANRKAIRQREDAERKEKEAEKAKDEQEALANARESAKKYFLDERISKALKKQKPKTKPVKIRQESVGGLVKAVEGKTTDGDQKGELYANGLILHKSFEEGSKDFVLTHARSGLGFPFSTKKSDMQELIGLIDLLGVDFNVDTDASGHLPAELIARIKKINTAWDNGDYSMLSEQDYATVEALAEVAKTDIDADLILTADDLGANGIPPGLDKLMSDKGLGLIKQMAVAVPEFAYDPVFTVKDGKLLYRDGYEFKLEPTAFNLHPSELKEGQTVGINLEDLGIKRATPQDVVAEVMKGAGFRRVTKGKGGDVSVSDGVSMSVSLQQGESDNDWVVVGGKPNVRGMAIAALEKIRWRQPGQDGDPKTDINEVAASSESQTTSSKSEAAEPQQPKAESAVEEDDSGEGGGIASMVDSVPTRQSRTAQRKSEVEKAGIAAADIQKTAERLFDVAIRQGGFNQRAAGIYKWITKRNTPPSPEVIRTTEDHYANLAVIAHEIAHHIDERTKAVRSMPKAVKDEVSKLDYEPEKGRAFEGWAEFLRRYMTEPPIDVNGNMIPNPGIDAPQTLAWFEETFLKANTDVGKAITEFRKYAQQFAQQSVFQRVSTLISDRQPHDLSFKERWLAKSKRWLHRLKTMFVDKFHTLEWIQEEANRRGRKGVGIYDLTMAYFMSATSHATIAFEEGVRNLQTGKPIGTTTLWGLREHLKSDGEYQDATRETLKALKALYILFFLIKLKTLEAI